ncbi:hypothetical protein K491DRAFT_703789 [Lophiostoma macrostomum CBS 122681]|uniref:Dipeptidase n=1 Tax=Lophiostoma macrostomum CBS 122681 TaxID=1314788 RepID=A0A6A6TD72_9PLEO|nr:hypothetical protein K491DRAFT_703789 [Lophiostoma macrostomum CBS 122681]
MNTCLETAYNILCRVPLIDGHNDWANTIRGFYYNKIDARFDKDNNLVGHVDMKRFIEGHSGGVFLSAYVDCPKADDEFSDELHYEPLRDTLQQIDLIHRLVDTYANDLELAYKATDIQDIFGRKKIAVILSIEGLHQICNSSGVLRNYHRLGVRCATLAHSKNNRYAGSATSRTSSNRGLSDAGKDMVREMNRIGMMIDLSHVSEQTVLDTIDISLSPVVFTHSSCTAIHPHVRNVSDLVLHRLKENGGIMMVSLIPNLTCQEPTSATVSHVVDHIIHVGNLIGYDYVGLGSDYDGMPTTVTQLEDVSKFPNLVAELLRRSISPMEIEKIIGLNIIRVFDEVETRGRFIRQSDAFKVLEDCVKPLWKPELRDWCRLRWPDAQH